jgi:hypothetical protein
MTSQPICGRLISTEPALGSQQAATLLKSAATPEARDHVRRELESHAAHLTGLLSEQAA